MVVLYTLKKETKRCEQVVTDFYFAIRKSLLKYWAIAASLMHKNAVISDPFAYNRTFISVSH